MPDKRISIFDRMRGFHSEAEREAFMKGVSSEREKIASERVEMARKRGEQAARKKGTGLGINAQAAQDFIGNLGGSIQQDTSKPQAPQMDGERLLPGPAFQKPPERRKPSSPIDSISRMITG